jgi:hypothetical protein
MDVTHDWCAPSACSLEPAEQPGRVAEWDALFATWVRSVVPADDGVRLLLAPAPGRASVVADLADREARCCAFLAFGLTVTSSTLVLAVRADDEHSDVVATLAGRARSLLGSSR